MFKNAPVSYKDPFWSDLATQAANEFGVPADVLRNILLKGERSNADQVSSAGARTPFQIIPQTRQGIIKNYGFDPYATPLDSARGAAALIKESLQRNKGDVRKAVQEYHGGLDPKGYGPVNAAYIDRVVGTQEPKMENSKVSELLRMFNEKRGAQPTQNAPETPKAAPSGKVNELLAMFRAKTAQQPMDVPTPANLAATSAPVAPQEEAGFLDTLAGAGETALSLLTGATGGVVGMAAGGVGGLAQSLAEGTFGTQQGVKDVQASAMRGMQGLTYAPRTEAGQRMTGAVGDFAASTLPPVMPIIGPAGALSQGAATAVNRTANRLGMAPKLTPEQQGFRRPLDAEARGPIDPNAPIPSLDEINIMTDNGGMGFPDGVPPVAQPRQAQTAMTGEQLAQTAKSATSGLRKGRAEQVLTQQAAPNPEVLQAAERLGIREYLQPDHVSTSQAFRELSQAAKSVPGSELRAQEIQGLEQIGKRADDLINEIGGSKDLSTVNFRVRDDLQKTVDTLSEKSEVLYKRVAEKIPADQQFEATATLNYLNQRANDLGGVENLSSAEKSLLRELSPKPIKDSAGNVTGQKLPTYALLDSRRKEIGEAGRNKGKFKDNAGFLNDNLYRVLSEDQNRVAEQFGVGRVYDAAKKTVQTRKGVESDMVALFGKQIDQSLVTPLSSSIQGLAKGDEARFAKIITAIPPNMRKEVVASGLSTAFGRATKNGELNFNTYANWYEGLNKNKQAYNALMSNLDPSARQSLKDLYTISDGVRKATREFINTGRIMAVNDELKAADTVIGKVFDVAKRAAIAVPLEAGATALGAPGAGIASGLTAALMKGKSEPLKAVDKLLATPEFQKAVIDLSTKPNAPITKRSVKALVRTPAFRRYAEQVNLTGGPAAYERFMLSAMTQPEQEQ